MREILFRGKDADSGEWVYGYYAHFKNMLDVEADIIYTGYADRYMGSLLPEYYDVKPESVGQYTGLTDKNGTKIFEGDIVHWKKVPYFVRWDSKKAEFVFANDMEADYFVVGFNEHTTMKFCKVVGNIHDNPELLED